MGQGEIVDLERKAGQTELVQPSWFNVASIEPHARSMLTEKLQAEMSERRRLS